MSEQIELVRKIADACGGLPPRGLERPWIAAVLHVFAPNVSSELQKRWAWELAEAIHILRNGAWLN